MCPYRSRPRSDHDLASFEHGHLLSTDEKCIRYNLEHGNDITFGFPISSHERVWGVAGGCCTEKELRPSYVNKTNYNPPACGALTASTILDGSISKNDAEMHPPVPVTLQGIRRWCSMHTDDPKYTRKDGSAWTAPDCTVGIFRYRDDGRVAGFVPCNSWDCPVCGPLKRNRLNDKVSDTFDRMVERDLSLHFLTLNLRVPVGKQHIHQQNPMDVDGYHISGYVPQIDIAQCFQRFRSILHKKGYFTGATGAVKSETKFINKFGTHCTRITRERLPDDQAYFYVKEFSPPKHGYKNGSAKVTAGNRRHYHLLTNFDIPEDVIRDAWWHATNKTSTNVKMISETREFGALRGRYITKYINKSMANETFVPQYLPRERRYGKSVGLFSMQFESKGLCFYQGLAPIPTPDFVKTTGYSSVMDMAIGDPAKLPAYFSKQHPLA